MQRPEWYHILVKWADKDLAEQAGRARDMAAVHLAWRDVIGQVEDEGVRGRGEHPPVALVCGHA